MSYDSDVRRMFLAIIVVIVVVVRSLRVNQRLFFFPRQLSQPERVLRRLGVVFRCSLRFLVRTLPEFVDVLSNRSSKRSLLSHSLYLLLLFLFGGEHLFVNGTEYSLQCRTAIVSGGAQLCHNTRYYEPSHLAAPVFVASLRAPRPRQEKPTGRTRT